MADDDDWALLTLELERAVTDEQQRIRGAHHGRKYEGALVSEKSVCPPAAGALEELGAMINAPQGPLRKCKTSTVPLCDMDTKTGTASQRIAQAGIMSSKRTIRRVAQSHLWTPSTSEVLPPGTPGVLRLASSGLSHSTSGAVSLDGLCEGARGSYSGYSAMSLYHAQPRRMSYMGVIAPQTSDKAAGDPASGRGSENGSLPQLRSTGPISPMASRRRASHNSLNAGSNGPSRMQSSNGVALAGEQLSGDNHVQSLDMVLLRGSGSGSMRLSGSNYANTALTCLTDALVMDTRALLRRVRTDHGLGEPRQADDGSGSPVGAGMYRRMAAPPSPQRAKVVFPNIQDTGGSTGNSNGSHSPHMRSNEPRRRASRLGLPMQPDLSDGDTGSP